MSFLFDPGFLAALLISIIVIMPLLVLWHWFSSY